MRNDVIELIHRRRRQIVVHSIVYYMFNSNIVEDVVFDKWAHQLAELQDSCPEESEAVEYMVEEFRGFTGDTGYDLPLHDKRAGSVAQHLMRRKT